jgi:selenide,water dikinase
MVQMSQDFHLFMDLSTGGGVMIKEAKTKLTMLSEHVGCTAKIDAQELDQLVDLWQVEGNNRIIAGLAERDDVGCYNIGNGRLLLHTLDVITPVVDDPFAFGCIAVAHVLSDIYAKGGTPISALSFLGLSPKVMPSIEDIIAGASAKLSEAGVMLLGGHTISTSEPLVGFAVTGLIEHSNITPLSGARVGNKLVLTKPLGTGIISTAIKFSNLGLPGTCVDEEELEGAVQSMELLNSTASKIMSKYRANACTDVTGFGLVGHLSNLALASGVGVHLYSHLIPMLPGVVRLFEERITPVRLDENIKCYYPTKASTFDGIDFHWPILFCPESSGGLLIAIEEDRAEPFVEELKDAGVVYSTIIGEMISDASCRVLIDA